MLLSVIATANVKMPLLFADGMVLQRNKEIPVWGWADPNEKVEVHFNKQTKNILADKNGKWMVRLSAEKAGGPFELSITGKNKIVIKDVLVGEVWICSGQSNMEFQVAKTINADKEIADSNYPMIRHFGVAQDLSGHSKRRFKSRKMAGLLIKKMLANFTAVGYFFAKKLYAELKNPNRNHQYFLGRN
jgi:sialate O-acetylesterase